MSLVSGKILILGADGYLGWATLLYLSERGCDVVGADSLVKRRWEGEVGVKPLVPLMNYGERGRIWREVSGKRAELVNVDLIDYDALCELFCAVRPAAIVHYAEQPSAPFSMLDASHARATQHNNVLGSLNVIWAMKETCPDAHLVKLGTLGEYGTPNIEIEEGFIEISHRGRKDTLPFPRQPGSFYHLSKVHDSHNLAFAARLWSLKVTDLHQGIVYGMETEETARHPGLSTAFHYDAIFGTALNRFCCQAVAGVPITIYGSGGQKRGFINLRDTLRCVELAIQNPATPGELRVFNQFTEVFSIREVASAVAQASRDSGIDCQVECVNNPRMEDENHFYSPRNDRLRNLGLQATTLSKELVVSMLALIEKNRGRIDLGTMSPRIRWSYAGG